MIKESQKVLGINPGTRYLGYAVLYGQELVDWGIKVLKGKWSEGKIKKAIRILSDLIERYEPNVLVIKKLHPARRTENLLRLTNTIKRFVQRKNLKVYQYSIKEIEKSLIKNGKLNKRNIFEIMVECYPSLQIGQRREEICKNPYFYRTLEAVAGAVCHFGILR